MLSRVSEWYRVVNAQPSSESVDRRTNAARDLVKAFDESEDDELIASCAAGVVSGFEAGFAQDSLVVQTITSAVKSHESAFPQDLAENAIELRVLAAIALGEILVRNPDKAPDDSAILVASLIEAGLHPRPASKARFVKKMLEELSDIAAKVLSVAAQSRRRRLITMGERIKEVEDTADDPAAGLKALASAMKEVMQQAAIDREELNVLWWMFAGASSTTNESIADMPSGAAAVVCGADLANLCLLPPPRSVEAMLRRAVESNKKASGGRKLETIVADWSESIHSLLASSEDTKKVVEQYPTLFPLSWLCSRLLASQGSAGWGGEFEKKTGLSASASYAPVAIAIQAMKERVAQRLYEGGAGN